MVAACRRALFGQGIALLVLVATEVFPLPAVLLFGGLQLACASEAIGFGAAAVVALRGVGRGEGHAAQRAARVLFSAVLWGLAVRHMVLVVDPMMTSSLLVEGRTWGLGAAAWLAVGATTARRARWSAPESLGQQALWLALVGVLGGANTLAMAAARAAL